MPLLLLLLIYSDSVFFWVNLGTPSSMKHSLTAPPGAPLAFPWNTRASPIHLISSMHMLNDIQGVQILLTQLNDLLRVGLCTPEQCPARYCTQSMSCGLNLVWCLCHRSSHNPGESTEVPVQPPRRGCRPSAEEAGEHMVFSTWLLTSLLHLSGGGAELCLYLLGWR